MPRWSDVVRRGTVHAYVSEVISPEEYSKLTDDEFFGRIERGLYVNEATADAEFRHKKLAEHIERAIYLCPECGFSSFESKGDIFRCKRCDMKVRYLPTKELRGEGFKLPFRFVADWYDYQSEFMNVLDVLEYTQKPMYQEEAVLSEVIPCVKKIKICKCAKISLYGDRVEIAAEDGGRVFAFDKTTAITVLGRNKLNIYLDGKIYQIKGEKSFNALKYVHVYHRYKNIKKGDENVKFLGI